MAKVLIVYHTLSGNTEKLALAVKQGAAAQSVKHMGEHFFELKLAAQPLGEKLAHAVSA